MKDNQIIQDNRKNTRLLIKAGTRNALKCSKGKAESFDHKYLKFLVYSYCCEHSLECCTEATFMGGGRGDIVILDWNLTIEILISESYPIYQRKKYPLPVIPVHYNISLEELNSMLDELRDTNGSCWEYYAEGNYETRKKDL